jgi:hypothetical protein
MRLKLSVALVAFALLSATLATSVAQEPEQDDQQIVDDFITSRGVSFDDPGKPKAKPSTQSQSGRKNSGAKSSGGGMGSGKKGPSTSFGNLASKKKPSTTTKEPGGGQEFDAQASGPGADAGPGAGTTSAASTLKASGASKGQPNAIGLGYTLFIKQDENILSADLGREFKGGDMIRVALETNTDGYLYIFHTENGLKPQMLFPHAQIDGGANAIAAHARDFIPADMKTWFEFDNVPATERLYIVVARQPLAGVPVGNELVKFCGGPREGCYWKPSPAQWYSIKSGAPGARVLESKNVQLAGVQTPIPNNSLARGIKVKKDEPAPAVVRINNSPTADVLVTTIDLVHK